jgi:paraquat-inducible protein B
MTEQTEHAACDPDLPDAPDAAVQDRRRHVSLVWLVPVLAALIGGWLVYKAVAEKGPEITITFKSATGLEAGKTKIKFKNVELGQVDEIQLSEDLSTVTVRAQLVKEAERFLSENTRFWVVRARVAASGISGLGTVFSGAYIDMDMGKPGKTSRQFTGLEEPPIVTTDLPGRHFTLEAARLGSIEVGAPVTFRQIRVGEVAAYHLTPDGSKIVFTVFVHAPFHQFVRKNTRFWNASGVNFRVDAEGVKLDTESLVSIVLGGIAFDVFETFEQPAEQAAENATFSLYSSREAAQERTYTEKSHFVLSFDVSVRGLAPGAPVEFRGIRIGKVLDINLEFDVAKKDFNIPVLIELEPERIATKGDLPGGLAGEKIIDFLVEKGLRAQLKTGNLLTGQQIIGMDFFPAAPPARVLRAGAHPEIPTVPTPFEEIGSKLTRLIAKLENVPIEQIGTDLAATIQGARRIANTAELAETLKSTQAAARELQTLAAELRRGLTPEINATLEQARKSLAAAEQMLSAGSPAQHRLNAALEELAGAARAFRILADFIERHPDSMIYGKGKKE